MSNLNQLLGHLKEELEKSYSVEERIRDKVVEKLIKDELGIDLSTHYVELPLKNPIILAPGHLTCAAPQIEMAAKAGFGAVVLKSVVGEDENGNASMESMRRTSPIKWVKDEEGNPVPHWKGGLDTRKFPEYLEFAKEAYKIGQKYDVPIIASILCHLPRSIDEEWKEEEWIYTTRKLYEIGFNLIEIDKCPFLKEDETAIGNEELVLRRYIEATKLIKEVSPEIKVIPKILNLDYGMDFQEEMVKSAVEGGADGVTIANRFFVKGYVNKETGEVYDTAHGGKQLRERNQECVGRVRQSGIKIPISATGGIYTGEHALEYLTLGAQNVQILAYAFRIGVKNAFRNLLLDPQTGLVKSMLSKEIYSFD